MRKKSGSPQSSRIGKTLGTGESEDGNFLKDLRTEGKKSEKSGKIRSAFCPGNLTKGNRQFARTGVPVKREGREGD